MKIDLQITFGGLGIILVIPFLYGFWHWNFGLIIGSMILQIVSIIFCLVFYHKIYDTKKKVIINE